LVTLKFWRRFIIHYWTRVSCIRVRQMAPLCAPLQRRSIIFTRSADTITLKICKFVTLFSARETFQCLIVDIQ